MRISIESLPIQNFVSLREGRGRRRGRGETDSASSANDRHIPQTTHPMTRAPAVLIQRPSPNGFGGTGDNSKSILDEGALDVAGRGSAIAMDEVVMALTARRLGDRRERTKGLLLKRKVDGMSGSSEADRH